VSELAASNQQRMNALEAQGFSIEPTLLLKMRLDLLTAFLVEEWLVNEDAMNREWEKCISEALDQAESELARAKLLVALDSPDSQIVDL
jgi:hypothetical protein